jgi:hypothetical protein
MIVLTVGRTIVVLDEADFHASRLVLRWGEKI